MFISLTNCKLQINEKEEELEKHVFCWSRTHRCDVGKLANNVSFSCNNLLYDSNITRDIDIHGYTLIVSLLLITSACISVFVSPGYLPCFFMPHMHHVVKLVIVFL